MTPLFQGTPANIRINLILSEPRVIGSGVFRNVKRGAWGGRVPKALEWRRRRRPRGWGLGSSLGYINVTESVVYLHSNFRGGLRKTHVFWNTVRNDPSSSAKVVDFGTNRKHVCDFLLVVNSNLGPILPRFRDIVGFLREGPHPYSTRMLEVFRLD